MHRFDEIIELVRSVAPESVGNLNPPATSTEIGMIQREILDVPQELLDLLRLHNGEEAISWMSVLPNGMQLMNVSLILEFSSYRRSTKDDFIHNLEELVAGNVMDMPAGPVKPVFSSSRRIPFAQFNADTTWEFDMDPAAGGKVGQIVEEYSEGGILRVLAPSLGQLFDAYADDLKKGIFYADEEGQIVSDHEVWPN